MNIKILLLLVIVFSGANCQQYKQKVAYRGITDPDLNLEEQSKTCPFFGVRLEFCKFDQDYEQLILKCMPQNLKEIIARFKEKNVSETTPKLILVQGESGSGKTVTAQAIAQELGCAYISLTALNVFQGSYMDTPQRVLVYAQELAKKNNALIIIEDVEIFNDLGVHLFNFLKFCHDENILIIANTIHKGSRGSWLEQYAKTISMESTVSDALREEFLAYQMQDCTCDQKVLKNWAEKIRNFKKYEIRNFGKKACVSAKRTRNSKEILEENCLKAYKKDLEERRIWGEL